jgi:hypothetical protein
VGGCVQETGVGAEEIREVFLEHGDALSPKTKSGDKPKLEIAQPWHAPALERYDL